MNTELEKNENLLKKGGANFQKNVETVGGHLYLTNYRLIFEAHKVNIQRASTEIILSEIDSCTKCWTKLLGLIPILPNSIVVSTKDGTEYRFVVFKRDEWLKEIKESKDKAIKDFNID